ncbi:MAG: EAL domain-containing protein, partial [Nitrospiria bacterium]
VGIALYPEHGITCESLIQSADRALYIAKKSDQKIQIGQDKYRLDSGTIKIVFQRIISISSGEIIGYEALSRDPNEQFSISSLFKKYEAIGKLMELKRICFFEQIKRSEKRGISRVFINIDFKLLDQIEPFPLPAHTEVILEISELDALHDISKHLLIAEKWRLRGFKFAIDDFGAGFISLPFMAKLIPDYIKLDRSTMLQAVTNSTFRIFAMDLVKTLKHFVVSGIIVEGVETEEELLVIKEMGVDIVQGFLFGEPVELEEDCPEGIIRADLASDRTTKSEMDDVLS